MSGHALKLSEELAGRIRAHGAEAYPHECCGALLGRDAQPRREVLGLVSLANRRQDSPRNRFSITPDDVRVAEKTARENGQQLVGWYHSHPDSPANPSDYDREHAWPWYSYIIVAVEAGMPGEMKSWRLAEDRASFAAEDIEVTAAAPAVGAICESVQPARPLSPEEASWQSR
jgi:proteasome lid subunit RPN8/RPN11